MFRSRRTYTFYKKEHSATRRVLRLVRTIGIVIAAYALFTHIVLGSYRIETAAMTPLLTEEESFLTSALPYGAKIPFTTGRLPGLSTPHRGDLAIVSLPYAVREGAGERMLDFLVRLVSGQRRELGEEGKLGRRTVRRIVALPGDTVRVEDFVVYVRPPGSESFSSEFELSPTRYELVRPELPSRWSRDYPFAGNQGEFTVSEGEYFVAADNRSASLDSRHFGPVDAAAIREKVVFRYWPMSRFGVPGN